MMSPAVWAPPSANTPMMSVVSPFRGLQVLADAAEIISTQTAALALRYMQTLLDMGSNQNSTIRPSRSS